jgi:hypothetical protein
LNSALKTIVFWTLILVTALLLYQTVQRSAKAVSEKNIQYRVIQVGTSVTDIRQALEVGSNNGWEFIAPVMENGTTTALIFKSEKK